MQLHELKSPKNSRKKKRIVGRGRGGVGKTCGRGENGQKSRTGCSLVRSSEGGQMPLIRRLPKVGFRSHRPILNQIITLEALNKLDNNTVVDKKLLKSEGLINSINKPFKILSKGEITKVLTLKVKSISASAKEKVIKAGGKVELIPKKTPMKKEFIKDKKNSSK